MFQTRAMAEHHTGANIAKVLLEAVEEWKLPSNPPLVTDNASNMVVAAREMESAIHVGCFAHTLNLACGSALKIPTVSKLLARMRRIVAFFHRSTIATALLKEKQQLLNLPQHKLIIDVQTRWNAAVDMTSRFLEQQPAIFAALTSKDLRGREKDLSTLSEEDITNAEELLSTLTPLKTATVALCEEKVPTLSIVLPLQNQLLSHVMVAREDDPGFTRSIKAAVSTDLSKRYHGVKKELLIATLLDPRFKSVPFLSAAERVVAFQSLILHAAKWFDAQSGQVTDQAQPTENQNAAAPAPTLPADHEPNLEPDYKKIKMDAHADENVGATKQPKPTALSNLFGDVYHVRVEEAKTTMEMAEEEVTRYKSELLTITVSDNPLLWWREHSSRYQILACLAKKYLGITATSVPSERVFSTAGDIVTAQRSALQSQHVDELIFLKKNWQT